MYISQITCIIVFCKRQQLNNKNPSLQSFSSLYVLSQGDNLSSPMTSQDCQLLLTVNQHYLYYVLKKLLYHSLGVGICIISGDPHYRTFDHTLIHFQGPCKYTLSRTKDECHLEPFEVILLMLLFTFTHS